MLPAGQEETLLDGQAPEQLSLLGDGKCSSRRSVSLKIMGINPLFWNLGEESYYQ